MRMRGKKTIIKTKRNILFAQAQPPQSPAMHTIKSQSDRVSSGRERSGPASLENDMRGFHLGDSTFFTASFAEENSLASLETFYW